jgi:serine protease
MNRTIGLINVTRRWVLALVVLIVSMASGCGGGGGGGGAAEPQQPVVQPPPTLSASSQGGTFNTSQQLILTSNGAPIFLTTDGSAPATTSTRYLQPLTLSANTTVRAVAIDSSGRSSAELRLVFVIDTEPPRDFALETATSVVTASNESAFVFNLANGEVEAQFLLEIDDESAQTPVIQRAGTVNSTPDFAMEVDLSSLVQGVITAAITLIDPAGNESAPYELGLTKADQAPAATVGGNVHIAANIQVDSDVNESSTPSIPNDSFANAQIAFGPGLLGGYVNEPGEGDTGNSFAAGDEDFFSVSLSAQEDVLLTIADNTADLDIELYDAAQNLVDDSLGFGNTELITAPADGDYFVRVFAYSGASNYTLTLGIPGMTLAQRPISSFDEFQPDAVVLQLDQKADQTLSALSNSLVGDHSRPQLPMLMAFAGAQARGRMMARANPPANFNRRRAGAGSKQRAKQETLWAIKALGKMPGVLGAEPNYWRQPMAVPNDPLYAEQWHYPQIRLPEAWDITVGNSDVTVAVLDTGVLLQHPDLAGQLTPGMDFISDIESAGDGDGIDSDPDDAGDGGFGDGSSSFHGTHVAGTIAAASNNNLGVAGVAWGSRIMPVRVLGSLGGSSYDLIQSIRFAAGLPNASGTLPSQPADVINMSLGGGGFSSSEADAIAAAREAGTIVVAAAGNSGSSVLEYPASYSGVVSVAATDQANALSEYSNFGAQIDVAAPGGDVGRDLDADGFPDGVLSTIGSDRGAGVAFGYRRYEGTSMAAPHVAGVIALMKSVYPGLTPDQFDQVLREGRITDDLGASGRDDVFGHGLINAEKAVLVAQQLAAGTLTPLPARLVASPNALDFGPLLNELQFTLSNAGGGELNIVSVNDDMSWLAIDATAAGADGLGKYRARADRTGLADGEYQGTITVTEASSVVPIAVRLRISSLTFTSNAGVLFALLVDAESGESVFQQRLINPTDGTYDFQFDAVDVGDYRLVVGSDMDNDGLICDAGEACGAYPTLNEPEDLAITADAEFSLDITFDQSRFLSANRVTAGTGEFKGYRYKDVVKSVSR